MVDAGSFILAARMLIGQRSIEAFAASINKVF